MFAFTIQGLPAHPLIVHGAVVGIPLAALGMLFYALRPASREKWWAPVFVTVVLAWLFTFFSGMTGEQLEHAMHHSKLIERHAHLAGQLGFAVHVMSAAAVIVLLFDRFSARLSGGFATFARRLRLVALPVVAATALASLVLVALTGHAGAKAAWHDSPASASRSAGS